MNGGCGWASGRAKARGREGGGQEDSAMPARRRRRCPARPPPRSPSPASCSRPVCAPRVGAHLCACAGTRACELACVCALACTRACLHGMQSNPPASSRAESLMRTPAHPLFGANFSSLGAYAIKHPPAHQSLVSRAQSLMPVLCRWRDRRRACTSLPFEAPACFERSNALRMRSNAPACVRMRRRASFSAAICPRVCVRKHRRHSCLARCR